MQNNHSHDQYFETQVLTASPQKLRLMLIEGAIRFGRQALECWDENESEALRLVARTRDIVTELLSGTSGAEGEVGQKNKDLYTFLFGQIALAQLQKDRDKLTAVIEVLEIEQETWQKVCEMMPEAPEREKPREVTAADCPAEIPADPPANIIPPAHFPGTTTPLSQDNFSLDA